MDHSKICHTADGDVGAPDDDNNQLLVLRVFFFFSFTNIRCLLVTACQMWATAVTLLHILQLLILGYSYLTRALGLNNFNSKNK